MDGEEITSFLLKASLTSLVFEPELYVNGAAANEYAYVHFVRNVSAAVEATTVNFNSIDWKLPAHSADATGWWYYKADNISATKNVFINPVDTVFYHVNPSNANLTGAKYSFLSSTKESIVTRGTGSDSAPAFDATYLSYENGILAVGLKGSSEDIAIENESVKTVFALRATVGKDGKDTTVTSDYASLYASVLRFTCLGYTSDEYVGDNSSFNGHYGASVTIPSANLYDVKDNHLYSTAAVALGKAPSVKVRYNESVNLSEAVTAHAESGSASARFDNNGNTFDYAKRFPNNDYGVQFKFDLIDYTRDVVGAVSESSFATLEEKDGEIFLTPRKKADGTTADITSVGRCPLVRVTLSDASGNIILVGFIKVEITVDDTIEGALGVWTANFGTANFQRSASPDEMTKVAAATGLTASQFVSDYDLFKENQDYDDHNGGYYTGSQAVQYYKDADDNFIAVTTSSGTHLGKIDEDANALRWTLTPAELDIIYVTKKNHRDTVYVKYLPTVSASNDGFYVPLIVTVAKPTATVGTKISEYWFNDGKSAKINVAVPNAATPEVVLTTEWWKTKIGNCWVGNKPAFTLSSDADEFADAAANYKYYFAPEQPKFTIGGKDYQLYVKNTRVYGKYLYGYNEITDNSKIAENELAAGLDVTAGNSIYANNILYCKDAAGVERVVATINQTTGVVTMGKLDISKLLLNEYASDPTTGYEEAKFYANIGVVAYNRNDVAVSLTENAINPYHFLRPANAEPKATALTFTDSKDANADESNISLFDLFEFTDWRGEKFLKAADDYTNLWYFKYYGVTGVKVDVANITTTLGGGTLGTTKLSAVNSNIEVGLWKGDRSGAASGNALTVDYSSDFTSSAAWVANDLALLQKGFGSIHYHNATDNPISSQYKLQIPVTFTYVWGEITKTVDITVKPLGE